MRLTPPRSITSRAKLSLRKGRGQRPADALGASPSRRSSFHPRDHLSMSAAFKVSK